MASVLRSSPWAVEVLHDTLHGHGVDVAQLGDACDEGSVIVGALQGSKGSPALHDGAVLGIDVYVVYLLDEAHGHEDVSYHVMSVNQACLHFVETGVGGIDVLFLDLHFIVFLAPGAVVGLLPWLRLRSCLLTIRIWSGFIGSSGWRSLLLRLVLL